MTRHFHAAPWSTSLKAVSLLATIMLAAVSYSAYRVVPARAGFTHNFGLGVAMIPIVILVGCASFAVRGYSVDLTRLSVQRLVGSTTMSLTGLSRAWFDPDACKGSMRVVGNGGLFSFSGWFSSKRLGRYRLFATDFTRAVVLSLPSGNVVISPAAPQAFVAHLQHIFPGLNVQPEEPGV